LGYKQYPQGQSNGLSDLERFVIQAGGLECSSLPEHRVRQTQIWRGTGNRAPSARGPLADCVQRKYSVSSLTRMSLSWLHSLAGHAGSS